MLTRNPIEIIDLTSKTFSIKNVISQVFILLVGYCFNTAIIFSVVVNSRFRLNLKETNIVM